jgi:hypothetical protein
MAKLVHIDLTDNEAITLINLLHTAMYKFTLHENTKDITNSIIEKVRYARDRDS